jgi:hypothetical protein
MGKSHFNSKSRLSMADLIAQELKQDPDTLAASKKFGTDYIINNKKLAAQFQDYLYSSKNDLNPKFNLNSFCPLIGPENSGKTLWIKKAIKTFLGTGEGNFNKLVIFCDLDKYPLMNFDTFITRFERLQIDTISTHYARHGAYQRFTKTLFSVLNSKYDPEYIDRAFTMALCDLFNGIQTFGDDFESGQLDEAQAKLLNDKIKGYQRGYDYTKNNNKSFLVGNIEEITDSLVTTKLVAANGPEDDWLGDMVRFRTMLGLVKCATNIIENERNQCNAYEPQVLINSGTEFTDIVLDLLNFEGGYHTLSNFEVPFAQAQAKAQESDPQNPNPEQDAGSPEREEVSGPISYIDSVLVINGYSRLDLHKRTDPRVQNFIDHLILRT